MALRLYLLLVAICLGPAALAAEPARYTRDLALPAWIAPLAAAAPATHKDPVVIRLAESQVFLGARTSLLVHRVVQVNEKASLREIGQYRMSFNPAYQKLVVHRIVVQRAQQQLDRTSATKIRLVDREEELDADVLGGRVTAQILLEDVRVGDSLDIVYSIEGTNPVFGDRWSDSFNLDDKAPIERRRIVVTHPQSRPIQWRQLGDHRRSPVSATVEPAGMRERLILEARDMDGVQFEPSIPASFIPVQLIQISEYRSWNEVAQWAARLFPGGRPSPAVQALAPQFAKSGSTIRQASEALHWVQEQIRYLSVSIGENSHRPQAPDEVLRRRYGDCKDKTNLYLAILAALGIRGEPVLVATSATELPGRMLPTPEWFDHVIVRVHVDGKTYYVDPTRTDELGDLPALVSAFPGAHVLPASMNVESLLVLPAAASSSPTLEREESWTIEEFDGDAILELRQRWRGLHALAARGGWGRASKSEREDTLLAGLEKNYPGVRLLGDPVTKNLENGAVFSVTARFTVPAAVALRDGTYELPYHSGIVDGTIGLPEKLSRSFPFALAGGTFHGRYLAHVQWPRHARTTIEPLARHLDNAFFSAHSEVVQQGNRLELVFDYRLKRAEIGKDEVLALQRESKTMFDLMEGAFRFQKDWAADPGFGAASYRELEAMTFLVSAGELWKLLEQPKWDEKQTERACGGAILFLNADTIPHARELSDLLAARLEKMTNSAKAQTCTVGLAFANGDPERASQLFGGRALGDSRQAPFQAELLLALGKTEQARISLLGEFDRLRSDGSLSQLQAVKLLALLQRTGGQLPTELVDYIAPDVDPTWPKPIASMLLDGLQEDDLIRLAEQSDGDLRAARLAEAWYYVGQHRLTRQDKPGAIAAFRWHRANGWRTLPETTFALAELRRLTENDADYRTGFQLAMAHKFEPAYTHYRTAAQRGTLEAEYRLGLLYADTRLDYPNALHWLNKALADGSDSAANQLAVMHEDGIGVAVDRKRAGELYEQAARMGNKHGTFNLADRLESGTGGFERDVARAFLLYRDAALLGHEDAMGKLAEFYGNGEAARDYRLSRFWATLGMLNGSMKAQAYLGFLYKWGHGVEKDQAKAVQLFREAAEQDVEMAQVQLGNSYEYGLGVARNAEEAIKWYEKASRHGNTYAQVNMAMLTLKRKPNPGEAEQAIRVLQQHLDKGDLDRAVDLGHVYKAGMGVTRDIPRAIGYYRAAAEQGHVQAQTSLADLYYLGPPTHRDCAAALAWYQKAVAGNDDNAINNLGDMYENGCGVPADIERAMALYARAAKMANPVAFSSLASLFAQGHGVQRAPVKAYLYYRISARLGYSKANQEADRLRDTIAKDQLAEADAQAVAWKKGDPLPGLATGGK